MKLYNFICLCIFVFFVSEISSQQEPPLLWIKSYGGGGWDYGRSIVQTSDGGFFAAGYKETWRGGNQLFLIKLNSNGDSLWSKLYGKSDQGNFRDKGFSAQQTDDGGFIIAGESYWNVSLVRTDSLGDTLWTKAIGTENSERGDCVRQTFDGGFVVCGKHCTDQVIKCVVYLVRTGYKGDSLWTKTYLKEGSYGKSVAQTADSGFIITGVTPEDTSLHSNTFLLKTNSKGDSLWAKEYHCNIRGDIGNSVLQTQDGGYVIAGHFEKTTSNRFVSIIRTDSIGDTLWTKSEYRGIANEIEQTKDGGFILTGGWGDDQGGMFILRTDPDGKHLWHKSFPHPITGINEGFSVKQTSDGGFIALGYGAADSSDIGAPNFLFIRLAPEGTPIKNNGTIISNKNIGNKLSYYLKGNKILITFNISTPENVRLSVYDIKGSLIKTMHDKKADIGTHTVEWNLRRSERNTLAKGVYVLKLTVGEYTISKKMTLLK